MTKLPRISGKDMIRALEKCGFFIKRQSGSHVIMRHRIDLLRRCIVPLHGNKTLKPGTLQSILHGANISVEELREHL